MLSGDDIERFMADGFVAVRQAVPPTVVAECQAELYRELAKRGVDIGDPTTWTEPVVRFWTPESESFAEAGTQPVLWAIYDQLLGPGRHVERHAVGGSVPVRFPSDVDPGDAGWHIDGSFPLDDWYGVNVHSRERGLLCLFLFSDVGPDDAPTEIKVGSHRHVPLTLSPFGEAGLLHDVTQFDVFATIERLPSAFATGQAGDVFVCHPFLVHRATWPHRGSGPRILAQPGIATRWPFELTGVGDIYPVERTIIDALGPQRPPSPGPGRCRDSPGGETVQGWR